MNEKTKHMNEKTKHMNEKTKQGTITTHVADDREISDAYGYCPHSAGMRNARKWALITFRLSRSSIRSDRARRLYYHKLAVALFAQGLNPWLGYGNEGILLDTRACHLGKVKKDLTAEIAKLDALKSR